MSAETIRQERLLVSAAVLTSFYGEFVKFVLSIWVYSVTQSVIAFAVLLLVGFLPNLLLAPTIGVWLDRTNKIRALRRATATLAGAALFGSVGIALALPQFFLALLVILSISIADAIEAPAYGVAATQLVAKPRLQSFNGITESARSFSIMMAPMLAGVLIAAINPVQIMLGAAAIAIAAWLILLGISPVDNGSQETALPHPSRGESVREFKKTLKLMLKEPSMFHLLATSVILNGLMASYIVLFYPMMLNQFTEEEVGLLRSSFALGMVAGGLVAQLPIMKRGGVRLVVFGTASVPLMLAAIALGPSFYTIAVLQAGIGAALTCMQARAQTLWQELTPEAVMGRVFSARRMIALGIVPVMYAIAPLLVQISIEALAFIPSLRNIMQGGAASERLTIAACSLCCLFSLLWLARSEAVPQASRNSDRR